MYSLRKFCTVTSPPNPLRSCHVTLGHPWGLRKNYGDSVLVAHVHNYSSVIYLSRNAFWTKSNRTEFDCIIFCSIGSIIELSKIDVRLYSITEPNRTIGVWLGSIEFYNYNNNDNEVSCLISQAQCLTNRGDWILVRFCLIWFAGVN